MGKWVKLGLAAGGLAGCGASNDDPAGSAASGGMGGTGGAPTKNVYVQSIQNVDSCLPRGLELDANNRFGNENQTCGIVEIQPAAGAACSCDVAHGRSALGGEHDVFPPAVVELLRNSGECGLADKPACDSLCQCEVAQLAGDDLRVCETELTDPGTLFGVCYVDPFVDLDHDGTPDANPELWADCSMTAQRRLRFMGGGFPAPGAWLAFACTTR